MQTSQAGIDLIKRFEGLRLKVYLCPAGVPTIGFGPGAEGDAHVVDEQLSLDELVKTARGYAGIIESVLGK